jgi:hypothetical protein
MSLPHLGAYEYVAHMLYCYSVQDDGKDGLRWLAMTEEQRAPWFLKARKRVNEWRAVERGCDSRGETAISFRPIDSVSGNYYSMTHGEDESGTAPGTAREAREDGSEAV